MRIRTRLLFLILAVLVPACLGSALGLAYIYSEQQKALHENMRQTARALALLLDKELAERETALRALSASPALAQGDLRAFYLHARTIADRRDAAIILSDSVGKQLLNTRLPFGAALPRMIPTERQMRAQFGPEATLVSNLYQPPSGLGSPSFAIQIPVARPGLPLQYLTLGSFAGQLQEVLDAQRLPQAWHASIIDRDGLIVARSRDADKFVGQPVRAAIRAKMSAADGLHQGMALSGAPATAFFSRAPGSGWTFLVSVPDAELRGAAVRTTALMAALVTLLLGLAVLAAFVVGRRTAQPLEALRRAAEQLGRNEPVAPQASGIDEVDAVNAAMVRAGERLRQANAGLERRVAQAVSSYERSQRALVQAQKLEALGRLTGGIAHDFNNVLQSLSSSLQATAGEAPEPLRAQLANCQRAVARGTGLARQLMVFGKVQDLRVETVDPGDRLGEARPLLEGALPSNVRLQYQLGPALWPVTVDPAQLELTLLNLVMNARDAMPQGGSMVLRVANEVLAQPPAELPPGHYLTLALIDNGEGMSDEVLARAFDPFFTTRNVGKGAGLGLAQAYGFARQSGGNLVLRSQLGRGTTATLYLPRTRQQPQPLTPPPMGEPTGRGSGRVLLVEDDPLVRDTVAAALEAAGFALQTADSADAALGLLERGECFDAVFSDVVMPGALSGVDLAQLIGQRWPRVKVVLATGYCERSVSLPGVRALAKPYPMQQAVQALNEAIQEAALP
ncbi:MAG TPA: ATP-binding protein [Ramlibacter sp.]|nr:ATP-binding protein [Ramlibacter sp.]